MNFYAIIHTATQAISDKTTRALLAQSFILSTKKSSAAFVNIDDAAEDFLILQVAPVQVGRFAVIGHFLFKEVGFHTIHITEALYPAHRVLNNLWIEDIKA